MSNIGVGIYTIRLGVLRVDVSPESLSHCASEWTDFAQIDGPLHPAGDGRDVDERIGILRELHRDKEVGLGASCRLDGSTLCIRLSLVASDAPKSKWRRTDHSRRQDLLRRLFAVVEVVWEVDARGRRLLDLGVSADVVELTHSRMMTCGWLSFTLLYPPLRRA
jgi:hypothetical protein